MLTLPNDVLLLIFSFFQSRIRHPGRERVRQHVIDNANFPLLTSVSPDGWNYRALCSISRASKQSRALGQPLLYHTLTVSEDDSFMPLMATLCKYPHLGRMVKELSLGLSGYSLESGRLRHIRQLFDEACVTLDLHAHIECLIREGLEKFESPMAFLDAALAFWLALTPNVVRLGMCIPLNPFSRIVPLLLGSSVAAPEIELEEFSPEGYFPFLRDIRLLPAHGMEIDEFMPPAYADGLSLFSTRPSMREFYAYDISWPKATDSLSTDDSYKLQHIHLERVNIGTDGVTHLFRSCSNLTSLRLNIHVLQEEAASTYDDLGNIFRKYGDKLEWLDLGFYSPENPILPPGHWRHTFKHADNMGGRLGSLRSLRRLRLLSLPLHSLLGLDMTSAKGEPPSFKPVLRLSDVLPDSLESLEVRCHMVDAESVGQEICGVFQCERLFCLRSILVTECLDHHRLPKSMEHLGWVEDQHQTRILTRRRDVKSYQQCLVYTKT